MRPASRSGRAMAKAEAAIELSAQSFEDYAKQAEGLLEPEKIESVDPASAEAKLVQELLAFCWRIFL